MDWIKTAALIGIVCSAGACTDRSQVTALEKKTAELQSSVETLKASVDHLEREQSFEKMMRDFDSIAYLTPGAEGYSVIQTDLGRITVMLKNVQAYANGTRITLQFGNLTSATINGAKAKIEWGSVDEKGSPKNEEARSRDVDFSEPPRAGAWTEVPIVLEGVPPKDFGFVRVRDMTHRGIRLLTK